MGTSRSWWNYCQLQSVKKLLVSMYECCHTNIFYQKKSDPFLLVVWYLVIRLMIWVHVACTIVEPKLQYTGQIHTKACAKLTNHLHVPAGLGCSLLTCWRLFFVVLWVVVTLSILIQSKNNTVLHVLSFHLELWAFDATECALQKVCGLQCTVCCVCGLNSKGRIQRGFDIFIAGSA